MSRSSGSTARRHSEDGLLVVEQRAPGMSLGLGRPSARRQSLEQDFYDALPTPYASTSATAALGYYEVGSGRVKAGEVWQGEATRLPSRSFSDPQMLLSNKPLVESNSRRAPASPPPSPLKTAIPLRPARASPPASPRHQTAPELPTKSPRRFHAPTSFQHALVEATPPTSPEDQMYQTAPNTLDKGKARQISVSLPTPIAFEPWSHLRRSSRTRSTDSYDVPEGVSTWSEMGNDDELVTPRSTMRSLPIWHADARISLVPSPVPVSPNPPPRRTRSAQPELESAATARFSDKSKWTSAAQLLDEEAEEMNEEVPLYDSGQEPRRTPSPLKRHRRLTSSDSVRSAGRRRAIRESQLAPSPPLVGSPSATSSPTHSPPLPGSFAPSNGLLGSPRRPSIKQRRSSLVASPSSLKSSISESGSPSLDKNESNASSGVSSSSHYGTPESTPYLRARTSEDLPGVPDVDQDTPIALTDELKRARTRARAIQELISTEWTYAQDLAIARDVYYARAQGAEFGDISAHLATSPDFMPPPTPAMQAHGFTPVSSPELNRRSFAPSPALQSTPAFTPSASFGSLGPPSPAVPAVVMSPTDVKTIFLNLTELATFGSAFSGVLDDAAGSILYGDPTGRDDRLGEEFLRMIPRIAALYSVYCSRHGSALVRLEELEPFLQGYLSECQELCKSLTHSWSLASLLIKPVQRCLKYPLLIETILANTPPEHPDYSNLEMALEKMLAVAQDLNEAKRRNEFVSKVVNKKDKPRRSSGLTTASFGQTVSKKILRSGYRAQKATGMDSPVVEDAEEATLLESLIARLDSTQAGLDSMALHVRSWLSAWLIVLQKNRALLQAWIEIYRPLEGEVEIQGGGRDVMRAFLRLIETIEEEVLGETTFRLHARIFTPLNRLDPLFQGPRAVILKRSSKRIDYERATRYPNDRSAQEGKAAYLGLSRALAEDLPVFLGVIGRTVDSLAVELAKIQCDFYQGKHARLAAFERNYCFKFAGSSDLVMAWWQLVKPLHSAIEGLSCIQSGLLMRRVEGVQVSASQWRSSKASITTDGSIVSGRAHSAPGISVESLLLPGEQRHQRHNSTLESGGIPPKPLHSARSFSAWIRKSNRSSASSPPTTPDELSSIRRFFAAPNNSSSPSLASTHKRNDSNLSAGSDTLTVRYYARSIRGFEAGTAGDGRALLSLRAGESIAVLWEEGDGWIFARSESTGLQGYMPREAVTTLPAGAATS